MCSTRIKHFMNGLNYSARLNKHFTSRDTFQKQFENLFLDTQLEVKRTY